MRKSKLYIARIYGDICCLKTVNWVDIILTILYWAVFVLGLLLPLYYLCRCCIHFADALQSFQKYSGLGFSHSFWYYFDKEDFFANALSLCVTSTQFIMYVILCRRAKDENASWISAAYFAVMVVLHLALYLHANSLEKPTIPIQNTVEGLIICYCNFTTYSLIAPFLYLAVYLLYVWRTKTMDGSPSWSTTPNR